MATTEEIINVQPIGEVDKSDLSSITPEANEILLVNPEFVGGKVLETTASGDIVESATTYQEELVSGTNIKTINNQSVLGSGNIEIQASGSLNDLSDVNITNPQQNQTLLYDATNSEFVNGTGFTANVENETIKFTGAIPSEIHVVEDYHSGYNGYRIWSNGYCEQWGLFLRASGGAGEQSVTFLKTYDNPPCVITNPRVMDDAPTYSFSSWVRESATTGFRFRSAYGNSDWKYDIFWIAKGYLAQGQY